MQPVETDFDTLKAEVEYTAGRKISTAKDCIDLSEAIFHKTAHTINSNTLRRFFGLIKSDYKASVNTLNVLAVFCGASSFEDLLNYRKLSYELAEKDAPVLLKYLIVLFESISISNVNDPTFLRLTYTTIDFLNQNSNIAYQFQKAIAKTYNGKQFYFEQFVNVDKLNSFYGKGLRYYLAENKTSDAQIFGNSLLCFRYWLTMDMQNIAHHHTNLLKHPVSSETHPCICARYYAAMLFYAEANGLATMHIILEANEFYKKAKSTNKYVNLIHLFEIILSEALILTGHFSEAHLYTTIGLRRNMAIAQHNVDTEFFKSIKLYHAIVLMNLGDDIRAGELFDEINPFEFYFITKQFHSILYLLLGTGLNKLRSGNEQLESLISSTGFNRMTRPVFLGVQKAG